MPTQNIDLGNTDDVQFDSQRVDKMYLDGTLIWERILNNFSLSPGNCGPVISAATGASKNISDIMKDLGIADYYPPHPSAAHMRMNGYNNPGHPFFSWTTGVCIQAGNCTWQLGATILRSNLDGCVGVTGTGGNYEQFRLQLVAHINAEYIRPDGTTPSYLNW